MQTDTTNSATAATDTTTTPTLADLVAAHRAKMQRDAMLDALEAVDANAGKYEDFQQRLANILPADLFAALALTFRWNGDIFSAYGGYPEATFTFLGVEWTIDNCSDWRITGPNIYRERIYSRDLPQELIRALADYEDIKPYLPAQPAEEPAEEPAQDEQAPRYNADLMSDEIPF